MFLDGFGGCRMVVADEEDEEEQEGLDWACGCRNLGRDVCGVAWVHQCCILIRWFARVGKDGCGSGGCDCWFFSVCCAMVSASSFHGLPLCPLTWKRWRS